MKRKIIIASIILTIFSCIKSYSVPNQEGWPVVIGNRMRCSPAVCDIDGDGKREIIFGSSNNKLHILNYKGENLKNWPQNINSYISYTSPAVGDIDNDGDLEIVVGTVLELFVFHHNGVIAYSFPKRIRISGTPTLIDINNDGKLEIIVPSGKKLHIYDYKGENIDGFPVELEGGISGSPAVGDIDNDGKMEICFGINLKDEQGKYTGHFYVLNYKGENLKNWPLKQEYGAFCGSPALSDFNNDGFLDICIPTMRKPMIFIWDKDGKDLLGTPIEIEGDGNFTGSISLGDVDCDNDFEICVMYHDYYEKGGGEIDKELIENVEEFKRRSSKIYLFHHNGKIADGWPVCTIVGGSLTYSTAIGDIDGDKKCEIIGGCGWQTIVAWSYDGKLKPGWPMWVDDWFHTTPFITDLDNDGDIDIVYNQNTDIMFVFDLNEEYDDTRVWWGTECCNNRRTGRLGSDMYEQDNDCRAATKISINIYSQIHNIYPVNDTDWFKVSAGKNEKIKVIIEKLGTEIEPEVEIFNNEMKPIEYELQVLENKIFIKFRSSEKNEFFIKVKNKLICNDLQKTKYSISVKGNNPPDPIGLEAEECEDSVKLRWTNWEKFKIKKFNIYISDEAPFSVCQKAVIARSPALSLKERDNKAISKGLPRDFVPGNDNKGASQGSHYKFLTSTRKKIFELKNLAEGKDYWISVTAVSSRKESGFSNWIKVRKKNVPPASPSGVSIINEGKSKIVLQWLPNKELDLEKYIIYFGTAINSINNKIEANKKITSFLFSDLKLFQDYYFFLRAKDKAGNLSDESEIVKTTPDNLFLGYEKKWELKQEKIPPKLTLILKILILIVFAIILVVLFLKYKTRKFDTKNNIKKLFLFIILFFGIIFVSKLFSNPILLYILYLSSLSLLFFILIILLRFFMFKITKSKVIFSAVLSMVILTFLCLLIYQNGLIKETKREIVNKKELINNLLDSFAIKTDILSNKLINREEFKSAIIQKNVYLIRLTIRYVMREEYLDFDNFGMSVLDKDLNLIAGLGLYPEIKNNKEFLKKVIKKKEFIKFIKAKDGINIVSTVPYIKDSNVLGYINTYHKLSDEFLYNLAYISGNEVELEIENNIISSTIGSGKIKQRFINAFLFKVSKLLRRLVSIQEIKTNYSSRFQILDSENNKIGNLILSQSIKDTRLEALSNIKLLFLLCMIILLVFIMVKIPWMEHEKKFLIQLSQNRKFLFLVLFVVALLNLFISTKIPILPFPLSEISFILSVFNYLLIIFVIIYFIKIFIWKNASKKLKLKLILTYFLMSLIPIILLIMVLIGAILNSYSGLLEKEIDIHINNLSNIFESFYKSDSGRFFNADLWKVLQETDFDKKYYTWMEIVKMSNFTFLSNYPDSFFTIQVSKKDDLNEGVNIYSDTAPPEYKMYHRNPKWLGYKNFSGLVSEKGKPYLKLVRNSEYAEHKLILEFYQPFNKNFLQKIEKKLNSVSLIGKVSLNSGKLSEKRPSKNLLYHDLDFTDWNTGKKYFSRIRMGFEITPELVKTTIPMIAVIFLLPFILSFIGGRIVYSGIADPVYSLTKGTEIISKGNLDYKIRLKTKDEFSILADSFNKMTSDLKKMYAEMIVKERMESELKMAHEIQQNLLPQKELEHFYLETSGTSISAREVGGDYYDYFALTENRVGIIIADVVGKGVPAALVMSSVKSILQVHAYDPTMSISDTFKMLHKVVKGLTRNKFVTMFIAVINPNNNKCYFGNAGHDQQYYFNSKAKKLINIGQPGPPLGVFEPAYIEEEFSINKGDVFIFYTDGVVEAMNENEEIFGFARFEKLIMQNVNNSPIVIKDNIISCVRSFCGDVEQSDDITIIVVKIKGNSKRNH